MFGHLNAEQFMDLVEGVKPTSRQRSHLEECERCMAKWRSMKSLYGDLPTFGNGDIPEPDWDNFRNVIRDALLSRAVQRASTIRRWTGWLVRPAVAWSLVLIAVSVTAGGFLWHVDTTQSVDVGAQGNPAVGTSLEFSTIDAELAIWTRVGMFEELVELEEEEEENFRRLLAMALEETR